jgi:DNA-binding transcriptional LysR family regulator
LQIGFDLKSLEVFVGIVKAGGMTSAGQRLGLTQSSVSQSLARLEEQLQVQLLDRSQRPPMLTPIGRQFYAKATELLDAACQFSREFRGRERALLQHVCIGMVDSLAMSVGPELIKLVRRRAAHWSLFSGRSDEHVEALQGRKCDIIITDDAVAKHTEMYRRKIVREPFVLVVPRLFTGPVGSLRSLALSADFIRYSKSTVIGRQIESQLQLWGIVPSQRMQLDSSSAVLYMVAAGVGWAITTPLCLLQANVLSGDVRCLKMAEGDLYRELTLASRPNELGNLPAQLADDTITVLRSRCLPILREHTPWLADLVQLGD